MSIRDNISEKSSDEIINKLNKDYYSSEAKTMALEILELRGIEYYKGMNESYPAEDSSAINLPNLKQSVLDSFSGNNTLSGAFWGIGLINFFIAVIALIGYEVFRGELLGELFGTLFAVALVGGPAIHSFCVFRCIKNNNNYFFEKFAAVYASIQLIIPISIFIGLIIKLIE